MYFSGIPFQGVVRHLIIINVLMFVGSYVVLGEEVFDSASMDYMSLGRLHLAAFLPGSPLFFYLFCGIGAYITQNAVQWWELSAAGIDPTTWNGSSLGASGAVFGILVAFAMTFPNQEIRLLFPPVAMRAKYFVPVMAVLELVYGVSGYQTGIAHFAHLGGAVFGLLLILFWNRKTRHYF
ncbi:MAG: rhomboid family intramembrane serine protease [Saprospiraceae bacterium]|nr:rhomboid family intramembrane serine protease [Saprospiraceae bacterium]